MAGTRTVAVPDESPERAPLTDLSTRDQRQLICERISQWSTRSKILIAAAIVVTAVFAALSPRIWIGRSSVQQQVPPLGPCPPACPDKWTLYNGTCYFASHETQDYTYSKNFCDKEGATLPPLNNETMEVIKYLRMEKTDLWIGLRRNPEGKWQWENGTLLAGDMSEDNKDLNCALFMEGIRPLACSTPRHWICMRAAKMLQGVRTL